MANTPLIAGPWRNIAGGLDLSLIATLAVAAVLYTVLLIAFPEPRAVFGPAGPRLVPAKDTPLTPVTAE
jgi:hypothetical protein